MQFVRHDNSYVLRFEDGELFPDRFLEFLAAEEIRGGGFTGIGAMQWTRIAFFDIESRKYLDRQLDEQFEVLALVGNVAMHDAQPVVHAHITLGRADYSVLGGHLVQGAVRPTLEVVLHTTPEPLIREIDLKYGLPTLQL